MRPPPEKIQRLRGSQLPIYQRGCLEQLLFVIGWGVIVVGIILVIPMLFTSGGPFLAALIPGLFYAGCTLLVLCSILDRLARLVQLREWELKRRLEEERGEDLL